MNNDGASDTATILRQGVGVVPTSSVGRSKPLVGTLAKRRNGTFRHTGNTVLVVGAVLSDTVPMDGGSVVGQQVGDCDLNPIAVVDLDGRTRCTAIDQECGTGSSIEVGLIRSDSQLEVLGVTRLVVLMSVVADGLAAPLATVACGVVTAAALRKRREGDRWEARGCAGSESRCRASSACK